MLVKDLSTTGAGILVDAATDRELVDTENVHIELRLFGADDEGIQLRGRTIHRKLLGSSVKHGIVFDTRGTPGFERKENLGEHFLMQGWRKEYVGDLLMSILDGSKAMVIGENGKVQLIPAEKK